MKRLKEKHATSISVWKSPGIKKIMANSKRKASINAKLQYLDFMEDIENIRKQAGISQTELAKLTKISQEELSRIERGKRNITFDTYFRIMNGLGYEPKITYHKIPRAHAHA
jgi:ribosome-binding protein aMBF1 (putative translation factor)